MEGVRDLVLYLGECFCLCDLRFPTFISLPLQLCVVFPSTWHTFSIADFFNICKGFFFSLIAKPGYIFSLLFFSKSQQRVIDPTIFFFSFFLYWRLSSHSGPLLLFSPPLESSHGAPLPLSPSRSFHQKQNINLKQYEIRTFIKALNYSVNKEWKLYSFIQTA